MTDRFYRYIFETKGGYRIIHDNEDYGFYEDLADALYERDRLEQVNWDIDLWCELVDTPNFYKSIELPTFSKSSGKYITHIPERWRVQKKINGKIKYFGSYATREDAEKKVLELKSNGWCNHE